jgi:hypothetical protein
VERERWTAGYDEGEDESESKRMYPRVSAHRGIEAARNMPRTMPSLQDSTFGIAFEFTRFRGSDGRPEE